MVGLPLHDIFFLSIPHYLFPIHEVYVCGTGEHVARSLVTRLRAVDKEVQSTAFLYQEQAADKYFQSISYICYNERKQAEKEVYRQQFKYKAT
jgi:hypothetical protein